ncbi:MAG: nciI [Deltaproteobacteria bacterium CG11_big_fil_rev_8_21_14_0_20_49_13]|nr:MAG: nciI [Deltaproteobacteria bacterium CG11_big_fil_rev_8_21_14_0_20_49_13]
MNKVYTKDQLIRRLRDIKKMGWVENTRHGNCGGVGNTMEDLLGIEENNLPLPNASEWELKCQRINTQSLVTLFHVEPSSTALKFVPVILLPRYGWPHKEAGRKYPKNEQSFRQTISCLKRSDRGFTVVVDRTNKKVLISFAYKSVDPRHSKWLSKVKSRVGLGELSPQPYWGFDDLFHKAGTKLHNCFFIEAAVQKYEGRELFEYQKIMMLSGFSKEKFIRTIESGDILIDFDARTGHNHGTKFRFRNNKLPSLYEKATEI